MQSEDDSTVLAMSNRRRAGLIVLCLFVIILLIWLDNSIARRGRNQRIVSGKKIYSSDHADYHGKTFTVNNIIDGDTIDIKAPDGRHQYTRIRLLGIDTPETGKEDSSGMYFASEAAEFTSKATLGKTVTVYLGNPGPTRGKYGRLLAYVKLPDGRFLNEVLLNEGYAYADLRFRHCLYNKYKQLCESARKEQKGLWLNITEDQLPEWLKHN